MQYRIRVIWELSSVLQIGLVLADIICSEDCADMYNPKVVQSTMGSLGRVNVVYTDLVEWLKENKKCKNLFSFTGMVKM